MGRSPEEMRALRVAEKPSKANTEVLREVGEICGGKPVGSVSTARAGWIEGTFEIDSEVHEKLIDVHSKAGSMEMNVLGYRRQFARQAVCMCLAAAPRGLKGVHLKQSLVLPLQRRRVTTLEIELECATLGSVPGWDRATLTRETRWKTYASVFAAATVLQDTTGALEIKTYTW